MDELIQKMKASAAKGFYYKGVSRARAFKGHLVRKV